MKPRFKSLALGVAILLAAVTGVAASVSVDYDHKADFEKYKTFAIVFAEGQDNLEASSPLVHQTILGDIKKHLVLHGLQEVKTEPDLILTYHVATEDDTVLDTTEYGYGFGSGFGPGWGWDGSGWGSGTIQMMSFTVGTVIIDAFDTGTKLGIWRGVMTEVISGNIKKTRKHAGRDIDKMFEMWAKRHEKDQQEAEKAKD